MSRSRWIALFTALLFAFAAAPAGAAGVGDLKTNLAKSEIQVTASGTVTTLTDEETADLTAMGIGDDFGAVKGIRRTGFNIYTDTPSFDNWCGKTFVNKGGTCLGMDVIIKHFYENVVFRTGKPDTGEQIVNALLGKRMTVYGYKNFRELSTGQESLLKNYMVAGHLDNYNPETILKGILNLFGGEFADSQRGLLLENLRLGKPAIVAMFNCKPREVNGVKIAALKDLSNGHAIMAWKAIDYEKKTLFFMYDPNVVYVEKEKNHRKYALVFDKASKLWTLFPSSYKSWYADWYPDHLLVSSANHTDDLIRSEIFALLEKAGQATQQVVEQVVEGGKTVVEKIGEGISNAWNAVTTGAKKLWDSLF